ncbi:MAG: dihydroorotate dehydrogenase electron transfer subunit [Chloroflexi bacterium]|nr:dihydroorotate dehydrogenase electron transfer subunit [Chloroflexota bacterium]
MAETLYARMRVVRKVTEGSIGVTLILDGELPCEPGQFAMVWVPGVEERPFTLMNDTPVGLTIAEVGPLTHALCALNPGDWVWLRGPYGHGYPLQGERLLLIGGGSGSASLALLAKRAKLHDLHVRTFLGARSASLLMLAWYMADLSEKLSIATDDGTLGFHGSVLQAAASDLPWATAVYACGPEGMLAALAASRKPDAPPCWVNLERVMRCGIGVCGSCHCGSQLVCADGPVFAVEKVAAYLGSGHT